MYNNSYNEYYKEVCVKTIKSLDAKDWQILNKNKKYLNTKFAKLPITVVQFYYISQLTQ